MHGRIGTDRMLAAAWRLRFQTLRMHDGLRRHSPPPSDVESAIEAVESALDDLDQQLGILDAAMYRHSRNMR